MGRASNRRMHAPRTCLLSEEYILNKSIRLVDLVVLALMVTAILPMTAVVVQSVSAGTAEPPVDEEFASSYVDTPYRKAPLSILAYIEYADLSSDGEYEQVRAAIDAEYGRTYQWDEFNDSSDLGNLLPGHDVLLILEQENAYRANMSDMAATWGSTLTDYVTAGGVIVLMDFFALGGEGDYGVTAVLYNETGLMTLYEYDIVNYENVDVTNSSNALARGVATTFEATNGAIAFQTDEGIPVVSSQSDSEYHLVIDKIVGGGHVVLLGFDMFNRVTDFDKLLANALRLPWHVVFDESHFPLNTVETGHALFAADLVAAGFAVSWVTTLDPDYLQASDVLIIGISDEIYTGSDIEVLQDFVNEGKGLFVATDYWNFGDYSDELLLSFGFERYNDSALYDVDNYDGYTANVYYTGKNLINCSCNLQVSRLETPAATGFSSMPDGARSIVVTDTDNTTKWGYEAGPGALGVTVAACATYDSLGRVFVIGDTNIMDSSMDNDGDGTVDYSDSDNEVFLVNCIRWLFGAGVKERTVLVDLSNSPYLSLSSTIAAWRMLTLNGLNVKWMASFNVNLLNEVNILVVTAGATAYPSEEIDAVAAFVERGGGLVMYCDWGIFGNVVGAIAERFGLIREPSTYLTDTDDHILYAPYIKYDGLNIQPHPITSGVSRIEVDLSGALLDIGGAAPIIVTASDNTSTYLNGTITGSLSVFAAVEYGLGRAVFFPDVDFWSLSYDPENDGWKTFYDSDNDLLTANSFWWLAENRAPSVAVTYPDGGEGIEDTVTITWNATDPNLDEMDFALDYSLDGGSTWTPIASAVADKQYSWNTATLADGAEYLIRVTASDGVLEASDVSGSEFTVDNNAPVITNVAYSPASLGAGLPVVVSADVVDVSAIVSVECRYSIDGGDTWATKVMSLASGETYDCSIGSFNASTTVTYMIRATDAMGHVSDWTPEEQFTVPAALDVMLLAIIAVAAAGIVILVVLLRRRGK